VISLICYRIRIEEHRPQPASTSKNKYEVTQNGSKLQRMQDKKHVSRIKGDKNTPER